MALSKILPLVKSFSASRLVVCLQGIVSGNRMTHTNKEHAQQTPYKPHYCEKRFQYVMRSCTLSSVRVKCKNMLHCTDIVHFVYFQYVFSRTIFEVKHVSDKHHLCENNILAKFVCTCARTFLC